MGAHCPGVSPTLSKVVSQEKTLSNNKFTMARLRISQSHVKTNLGNPLNSVTRIVTFCIGGTAKLGQLHLRRSPLKSFIKEPESRINFIKPPLGPTFELRNPFSVECSAQQICRAAPA